MNGPSRKAAGPAVRARAAIRAAIVADQLADGATRRRVGLRAHGRAPVRGGADLFADEAGTQPAGRVTSGAFGPSVGGPVAMGYVAADHAATGTPLFASVRGRLLPVTVTAMPFVAPTFRR